MSHSLRKRSPRRWSWKKSLHLSLSISSFFASSIRLPYSFTLFFHLKTGLPLLLGPSVSLTYTFFTNSSLFFLFTLPKHLKLFLSTHSTLHSICTSFIHTSIALTLPSYHAICSSQITYFHTTHSWLVCPIPCPNLWSIHQCWQENNIL